MSGTLSGVHRNASVTATESTRTSTYVTSVSQGFGTSASSGPSPYSSNQITNGWLRKMPNDRSEA